MTDQSFSVGEQWTYRAPAEFENSRIVIGAIVSFADSDPIVCCAVFGAPRRLPDGRTAPVTIPFLPMQVSALAASVVSRDGNADVPQDFAVAFENWQHDARGLSVFTVPFEGRLDALIARQMAQSLPPAAE